MSQRRKINNSGFLYQPVINRPENNNRTNSIRYTALNTTNHKIMNTPAKVSENVNKLVIYSKLPEIIGAIKNSMITIIRSDTGSGKTIGVPNYLSQDWQFEGKIFCSVPTITATLSAHRFQSQLFGNKKNQVGYACDGDIHYNDNTKIVYCTTGHLLNKMIDNTSRFSWFCSVLILDEYHIRSKESDISLCLWIASYKAWKENPNLPKPPKLVIMSATLDDSVLKLLPTEPSVLSYSIQTHPVTTVFDDESVNYDIDSIKRYTHAADLAYKYHTDDHGGTYLIFVPGKQEIDIVTNALEKHFGEHAEIVPAHSNLTNEELSKIHGDTVIGKRKIIVATNIAECSITIKNVSLVIDTLTHREASSGLDEIMCLDLHWISKSNAMQRKGRTGRTCPGTYIILQSEEMYSKLAENVTPEIDRVSISHTILKLIKFGLDPKNILNPVMTEWQIEIYTDPLNKLGFVKQQSNMITDMGNFCSEFPLSIRKSAMLYHLKNMNDPNIFLHLAVICTLNCYGTGIFYWPKKNPDEDVAAYSMRRDDIRQKIEDKFGGYSDVDTIFKIWIKICSTINPFYFTELRIFCQDNQLNFHRFKETVTLLKQCVSVGNRVRLNACYHSNDIENIDVKDLGKTFYHLLSLTHQDYETTISPDLRGGLIADCAGLRHRIDNRSLHLMELGNTDQIYYSLVRTQRTAKNGMFRMINVLHAVPESDMSGENLSIFSSDIDSDENIERFVSTLSNKQNWNKFLAIVESIDPPINIINQLDAPEIMDDDVDEILGQSN